MVGKVDQLLAATFEINLYHGNMTCIPFIGIDSYMKNFQFDQQQPLAIIALLITLDKMFHEFFTNKNQIDGLMQEKCNSSVLAMELCLSCINPPQSGYFVFLILNKQTFKCHSVYVALPIWQSVYWINPLCAEYFWGSIKICIVVFYINSSVWDGVSC